jgi:hypothetical protein
MRTRSRITNELNRRFPELTITGLTVRVVDEPGPPIAPFFFRLPV